VPRCLERFGSVVPTAAVGAPTLAVAEAIEQLDYGRLAQRAQAVGDELDRVIGEWVPRANRGSFLSVAGSRAAGHRSHRRSQ
jgi:hypothetical protein